jgi:hypothetical protein
MSKARELAELGAVYDSGALSNRNILINGAMKIDQRNSGSSVTPTTLYSQYTLDRWTANFSQASKATVQQNAGSVTPPSGFENYIGITQTGSTYTPTSNDVFALNQYVEGENISHLDFGKSTVKNLTVSFHVRSNVTGTYGIYITNSASNRIFVNSYTIDVADTWEYKTVSITGDTTGTWLTTNGVGFQFGFVFGAAGGKETSPNAYNASADYAPTGQTNILGTSGGYFYVTGCQLEVGSEATPFEHRLFGDELERCQRYFYKETYSSSGPYATQYVASHRMAFLFHPTTMRAVPTSTTSYSGGTMSEYQSTARHFKAYVAAQYDATGQNYLQTSYQADAEL